MELNQNLADFFPNNKQGSGGETPKPSASPGGLSLDLANFFPSQQAAPRQATSATGLDPERVNTIADTEGLSPTQKRVMTALLHQESGFGRNARTSVDGAQGPGQIIPATFRRYARAGEDIGNADHNLAVMARIVKDLGTKFGDDPGRIATGYFSGEGNVNRGSGQAWRNDAADGNRKRVSSYVSDVLTRLSGISDAQASEKPAAPKAELPDLGKAKPWAEIAKNPEYQALDTATKAQAKAAYFDYWIAPHAGGNASQMREKFLGMKDPTPGLMERAGEMVGKVGDAIKGVMPGLDGTAQGPATEPSAEELEQASKPAFNYRKPGGRTPAERDPNAINMPGSVMDGTVPQDNTLPTTSKAPVRPEVRAAFNAQWDAATPEQRAAMSKQEGVMGQLARERAGIFARQDEIAKGMPADNALRDVDPRIEARRAELIANGEDARVADTLARVASGRGVLPGQEIAAVGVMQDGSGTRQGQIMQMQADLQNAPQGDKPEGAEVATNAIMRGIHQGAGMLSGIAALGAKAVGAEDLALTMLKGYFQSSAKAKQYSAQIEDFTKIERLSDVPTYVLEGVLENLPQLAVTIGTGGVGGLLARKFGEKAVAKMVAEQAAKELSRRMAIGAAAGAGVSSIGMESGSIYGDIARETGQERPGVAASFGAVAGALDAIPAFRAATKILGKESVSWATKDIAKRYGKEALVQLGGEGFTEFLQTWVEKGAVSYVDGRPLFTKENLVEAVDAFLKGGAAGAVIGVGSQGVADIRNAPNIRAERDAEAARTAALKKWNTQGFVQPGRTEPTISAPAENLTEDGRIEPTMGALPPNVEVAPSEIAPVDINPMVQTADSIVSELASQAGVPLSTVLPTQGTPQQTTGPQSLSDEDIINRAEMRVAELWQKSSEGGGITPAEQQELDALTQAEGNPAALRKLYGFDQASSTDIRSDASANQTFGHTPAPVPGQAEQPTAGQQFPATMEPGLMAAQSQENANVQTQISAQQDGIAQPPVGSDGQPGGPAPVQEPAAQAAGTQVGAESGQRYEGVPAEDEVSAEKVAIQAAQIARRESPISSDPRIDRIGAQENYLQELARSNPEVASSIAQELRNNQEQYAEAAGVSPEMIGRYASVIEKQLSLAKPKTEKEARAKRAQQKEAANGTQAAQAQQAETQGSQAPAAPAVAPKTEREAREARRKTDILTPDGGRVAAQWDVVDADSVKASLKEGVSQPRDRMRAASNAQVLEIAGKPDFDRLSDTSKTMDYGAPTLSADGLIVGGNGRFEGVSQAYEGGKASGYLDSLLKSAGKFGLDPEAIRGMKKPILVRRITQEADTRKLAIQSNQAAGLQMSDMEQAALDAERMKLLDQVEVSDTGDIPLTSRNMQAIQQTLGGYATNELAGMMTADGGLSQSGMRRLRNAILFSAYGKSDTLARLIESPDADMKNIGTALVRAGAQLAKVRRSIAEGGVPAEYDISADLTAAIETLSSLRASGVTLADYLAQNDMFGGGISAEAKAIIQFLNDNLRSAKSISEYLNAYAQAVLSAEGASGGLFDDVTLPSKLETLKNAGQRFAAEKAAAKSQQSIFDQPAGKTGQQDRQQSEGQTGNARSDEEGAGQEVTKADPEFAPTNSGSRVTPQVASPSQLASFIAIAADSVKSLRRSDVDRVIQETPKQFRLAVAIHIKESRPDLASEVDDVMADIANTQPSTLPRNSERISAAPEVEKNATPDKKSEPASTITDFGQKIGGAKKDLWGTFSANMAKVSDDDIGNQPLSKSWPEPDYQAMLDSGADKWAVAFMHATRDAIPAKPRQGYKLRTWTSLVQGLRQTAIDLASGKISIDRAKAVLDEMGKSSSVVRDIAGRIDLYQAVGHSKSLSGVRISVGEYSIYEGVEYKPAKIIWSVEKQAAATAFSNWPRMLATGSTRAEAIQNFKEKFDSLTISQPASKEISFDIWSTRGQEGYRVGKKVGRNYIELAGPFATIKEAREYRTKNQAELVAKLEKAKEIPRERRDTNNPRVGEDMRGGQDVTPAMFGEAFGFRGVEFGNWVDQAKRQKDLNEAYDALMDMAAIIGVSPKALSLNGELGIAFGARGSGGVNPAAAHYEPGYVVINLTKKSGAGSLGHEWWHALDNYFSRMRKQGDKMMTDALDVSLASRGSNFEHRGEVRKEMIDAFGQVMKAIRTTAIRARSAKLDAKRTKEYWTTSPEMSARAFESYLISKLQDQNASNDYLANIVDEKTWEAAEKLGFELDGSYPYPTAGEVPAIRAGFDAFFDAIEQKKTDSGVMLYEPPTEYGGEKATGDVRESDYTDPYANTETRPGTTDKQREVGRDALADLERRLGLDRVSARNLASGSKASVLGNRMLANFQAGKPNQLTGQVASTPDDLAVLAQVYRDPRFETFRVVYMDGNKIIGEAGYTSRLPGAVTLPNAIDEKIEAEMKRFGADGYYIMHNHPSGRAMPSKADERLTVAIANSTPGFRGHVVIDSNEYATVDGKGNSRVVNADLKAVDFTSKPAVPHKLLGEQIDGPLTVARLARQLQIPQGHATLILTERSGKVQLLVDVPMGALSDQSRQGVLKGKALIRRMARDTGSGGYRFIVLPEGVNVKQLGDWVREGVFTDVVSASGESFLGLTVSSVRPDFIDEGGRAMEVREPGEKQTYTPEFKRWFGDSKVVDENGEPLVVYHGSPVRDFTIFDANKINSNDPDGPFNGFFFTSSEKDADSAGRFPWGRPNAEDPQTRAFYLSVKNPATRKEARAVSREITDAWRDGAYPNARSLQDATREELQKRGYDGIVFEPYVSPSREAFDQTGRVALGKNGGELVRAEDGSVDLYERGEYIVGYRNFDDAVASLKHGVFIAFRPEQIKSATGNNGQFDQANPDITRDLSRSPSYHFEGTDQAKRVNALAKLKALEKKRDSGKITDAEYRLGVQQLIASMQDQKDERTYRQVVNGRRRGTDWIIAKLRRGLADGTVPRNEVEFAEWLLEQNPNLGNDLGVSVKAPSDDGASGQYNPAASVMTLMLEGESAGDTTVHEIMHHAERMMPQSVQDAIVREWQRAWDAAYKKGDQKLKAALDDMLAASLGNRQAHQRVLNAMMTGTLNYAEHYQLYSPSEFWAVNSTRILSGRYKANESWVKRAIQWFKEFVQRAKGFLGLPSDAPVIKALNAVMKGDGNFQPNARMLVQQDISQWLNEKEVEQGTTKDLTVQNITNGAPPPYQPGLPLNDGQGGTSWQIGDSGRKDNFIYKWLDKNIDLRRAQEAIKENTSIIEQFDAYQREELYHGRVAVRSEKFLERELRPLLMDMRLKGIALDKLEAYLWARHAPERNAQIAKINDDMPDGGSGLTNAQVRQYFDGKDVLDANGEVIIEGLRPEDRRSLEALAARVDAINAGTKQVLLQYGLETPATIQAWEGTYSNYVPLHREDMDGSTPIGQGYSVKGSSSKRATGSKLKVVDIIGNIALQREAAITRGEKNRVGLALYGLALQNPNKDFWNTDRQPMISTIDKDTGMVHRIPDPKYKNLDNVLMVRVGGQDRAVVFNKNNDRAMRMAEAMKNLDVTQLDETTEKAAVITRYFASINTQYNVVFGMVNGMRDVQAAALNLSSTELRGKQAQMLANVPLALRAIWGVERGDEATSDMAKLYEEMRTAGGTTGYREIFRLGKDRTDALVKEIGKIDSGVPMKVVYAALDVLDAYNTAIENATRLAAYKVAKDAGMSQQKAASIAKNITVNFNRKGKSSRSWNAWYAFFNAAVQGTARTWETLTGPAGKRIMAGGLAIGVLQALAPILMGMDDDDWEAIPDFIKQRNLIIPTTGGRYVQIPMPLGFNIIPNIGRIATELFLSGGKNPGKKALELATVFLDNANPLGSSTLAQTAVPTIADPIVALAENKNFDGRRIYKENMGGREKPGFTRAKDSSSAVSRYMAEGINTLTGGDKYKPGMLSPTPDQLDYIFGTLTGGVGREMLKAYQAAELTAKGERVPLHRRPVVGRFYGSTDEDVSQASRYYRNMNELNTLEDGIKGRRRDRLDVEAFRRENPESSMIARSNAFERQVNKLRRERHDVEFDDKMRESERTARLKDLDARIQAKMREFNQEYAASKKNR